MKQTLTFDRTTKNTIVYKAPKGSAVDTLYIQKDAMLALPDPQPARIEITIAVVQATA